MDQVKTYVEQYAKLLPVAKAISYTEAERRAGQFLEAMATLTDWKHSFSEEKIKFTSVQSVTYAEQMSKGTAKTVTENKMMAEASPEYIKSREDLERVENDIAYLKAYYDLFMSAHVFYRQMCKNEGA